MQSQRESWVPSFYNGFQELEAEYSLLFGLLRTVEWFIANDQAPPPTLQSTWHITHGEISQTFSSAFAYSEFQIGTSKWANQVHGRPGSSILQLVDLNQPIQITKNFWWKFNILLNSTVPNAWGDEGLASASVPGSLLTMDWG